MEAVEAAGIGNEFGAFGCAFRGIVSTDFSAS